jgi:DUF4097 and DUF4098 domain-containing protein YvlB
MKLHFAPPLCLSLLFLSSAAVAADKTLDRRFEVKPGERLTVIADSGDLTVRGTDTHAVVVHIAARGSESELERLVLSAERTGQGVTVRAENDPSGWRKWLSFNWNTDIRVTVEVPRPYDINLKTAGGDIDVSRVQGRCDGKTSGGDVRLGDLQGPVNVETSGGDVEAGKIEGDTRLQTSGGSIVIDTVRGGLDVRTSGGGIRLRSIEGTTVAHTSSGDVLAETVRGDADLATSGGDIKGVDLDGRIRAHTSGGNIEVALVGANRGIEATSSGGDITITLPAAAKGSVEASSSGGSIKTDFPVSTTEIGERRLKGTINGGGASIRARTSGGSVRLQAQAE